MRELTCHPDTPRPPGLRVEAEAIREGKRLALRYRVSGATGGLVLPAPGRKKRSNGLWQHSCFEAFVRPSADPGYVELNLAPSRRWAAYRFSDYRDGMAEAEVDPPEILVERAGGWVELAAAVDLERPFGLIADLAWNVALAAVIEDRGGFLSYWALVHAGGAPDFHHPDCFALELAPAAAA